MRETKLIDRTNKKEFYEFQIFLMLQLNLKQEQQLIVIDKELLVKVISLPMEWPVKLLVLIAGLGEV